MQDILNPIFISLKVALTASVINLLFGVCVGYVLARKRFFGRDVVDTLLALPMVLPPTVLGYYLLLVLGREGWLGQWLEEKFGIYLIFTWQAAVLAACIVSFPLVLRPARAAFEAVEEHYEHAARTLGISEIGIFWRITLPLAWRSICAGVILAFARSLGEFGATMMVAGSIPGKTQTLSIAIYEAAQSDQQNLALIFVGLTSVVCFFALFFANYIAPEKISRINRNKT